MAWNVIPDEVRHLAVVTVYGLAILASYVVIAFGLMVTSSLPTSKLC
ncbi:hypothetical protein ACFLUC_00110 [Chloroflexota bacterium]